MQTRPARDFGRGGQRAAGPACAHPPRAPVGRSAVDGEQTGSGSAAANQDTVRMVQKSFARPASVTYA